MKKILSVLIAILALGFISANGFAEQKPVLKQPTAHDGPYDPAARYTGSYRNELVYYRYPNDSWQRKPKLDRLRYITCRDATERLAKGGTWAGTFKLDGSCGGVGHYGENPEWATGNWLNYEEQIVTQNQHNAQ